MIHFICTDVFQEYIKTLTHLSVGCTYYTFQVPTTSLDELTILYNEFYWIFT